MGKNTNIMKDWRIVVNFRQLNEKFNFSPLDDATRRRMSEKEIEGSMHSQFWCVKIMHFKRVKYFDIRMVIRRDMFKCRGGIYTHL